MAEQLKEVRFTLNTEQKEGKKVEGQVVCMRVCVGGIGRGRTYVIAVLPHCSSQISS